MNGDENWRPSAKKIAAAEQLLANTARFQTRLRIVQALRKNRGASLKTIAGAATTRTPVVEAFLERWRRGGLESVAECGRPKDLNEAQQIKVRKKLASGKLKALDQVRAFIQSEFGLKFDIRSVRSYCRRLGFELPTKSIRAEIRLHDSWNHANIARLAGSNEILKNRLMAIVRACSEPALALRKIAEADKPNFSPASTLRSDLKSIKPNTTLDWFVMRHLRLPMLDRRNLRQKFYEWASERYAVNGRSPSAREAVDFLKAEHRLSLAAKSVYKHLDDWRGHARIESRKYQPREKLVPSEGLSVRASL